MKDDPTSLDRLQGIVSPEPVPWWPLAPGWWILIALVLSWLVVLAGRSVQRYRKNGYRRAGLAEIDKLDQNGDHLGALSVILKRVALAAWPREKVASLTGPAWLSFLDASMGGNDFTTGPARVLGEVSSAGHKCPEPRVVFDTARRWIQTHEVSES